jgi:hypothetical protein
MRCRQEDDEIEIIVDIAPSRRGRGLPQRRTGCVDIATNPTSHVSRAAGAIERCAGSAL